MMFVAHVAGLAKADQIVAGVRQVSGGEKAEWPDVVNGKAFADVPTAIGALAVLIGDDCRPRYKPAAPAIGSRPANPIGGIFATRPRRIAAGGRAKPSNPVLFRQPRLLPEVRAAVSAREVKTRLPAAVGFTPNVFWAEGICRRLTGAKLVADQMRLGRCVQEGRCLPSRAAGCTAKARPVGPVRLNAKGRLADFTGLFDHAESITETGFMGKRTTLIACKRVDEAARQPDLLIPETRTAPVQQGLDL